MPKFSPKQLEIIDARDCNVLVSAAAGSGKTTVLVERIVQRILRDGIDIDRMLVLTFAKAAAGEMKERIAAAINKAIEADPANERLQKQAALIYNAQITTIDSFCLSIVKNNFAEIGIEPDFRLATEAEMTFIIDEVLDDTIEEILADRNIEHIEDFLNRFESKDSIKKIKAGIMGTYKEASKAPFPFDYLEEHRHDYDAKSFEELLTTDWMKELCIEIDKGIENSLNQAVSLREFCDKNGPVEYIPIIEKDIEQIRSIVLAKGYTGKYELLSGKIEWTRLANAKNCDETAKEYAKNVRETYKKAVSKIATAYFSVNPDKLIKRMQENSLVMNALADATTLFMTRLESEKRKRKLITFADMEHMALRILLKKENGVYVPSQTAIDYRSQFDELMIDEYQDSNYIQEALIHSISGEDDGRYDRFMVGDIKQSIYRFRNANPDLFAGKYHQYTKDTGKLRRIDLSMNYRSRDSVIDYTNTVFERIMDEELGGADYNDDSRLYRGGEFAATECDTKAELLLVHEDRECGLNAEELEALLIARKIHDLIENYQVQDKITGDMRPCRYQDIVILLRSGGSFTEELKRTLEKQSIPAYVTSKSGYFTSNEIVTLLNYLSIINNPDDDIALYGTLTSVFGKMNDNELALLRILDKNSLYAALRNAADMDVEEIVANNQELARLDILKLKVKCRDFLDRTNAYRELVPYTPIHELLRVIVRDADYMEYISALPMGEQKVANARMLLNKAEDFEENGFKGLFNFNRYIEKLKKYKSDEGEVVTLDENANVVRIMTMHKSKGLEFPVVILSDLDKGFNHGDEREEVVYHNRYGIGFNYIDVAKHAKYDDLRKKFIISMIKKDSLSEEIRILYVAMTRAKEKLIMTAVADELPEISEIPADKGLIPYSDRLSIDSYLDIIGMSRYDDDWNGQCSVTDYTYDMLISDEIGDRISSKELKEELISKAKGAVDPDNATLLDIRKRLDFEYHHINLKDLYTKTSVSELKMAAIHEGLIEGTMEEVPADFLAVHEEEGYVPSFVEREEREATGTTRGSAYHRVMELLDFEHLGEANDGGWLDEQMKKHIEAGALMEEDYKLVDKRKVCRFATSSLGQRMAAAARVSKLYREQPFVLGITANRLDKSFPADEQVLIQGIIDVFFEEDGDIILMDYKTDRVKEAKELVDRYKTQLDYYEEALTRITGKKVKERLVYSFALEATIQV